jgi:hypothetical protein
MRNFVCGVIVGLTLAGTLGYAGTFYDSKGQPNAPTGSVQQFDYFRERGLFLDVQRMRQQADSDRLKALTNPCGR